MTAVQVTGGVAAGRPVSCVFPVAPLSPAEVRELWAFIHGDIMVGGIRQQLRASLGLCPRHTWGYAVVEVELWIHGAGARGGHQPFDVCVLYADLLDHVAGRLRAQGHVFHHTLAATLQRHGPCRICDALGPDAEKSAPRVGYAGSNSFALAAEANELRYTTAWFAQTQDLWVTRACPECVRRDAATTLADGEPHAEPDTAVLCLEHVRAPGAETEVSVPALSAYLAALGERVDGLGMSMRQGALSPTPAQNASWIEALGWFAGWDLPLHVTGAHRATEASRGGGTRA